MKVCLILTLLLGVLVHAVPKQTDKTKPDQNNGYSERVADPNQSSAPISGPSSEKKKDSPDKKPQGVSWCQEIFKPLFDNWPLVAVAIWGIIVAARTLRSVQTQVALQFRPKMIVRKIELEYGSLAVEGKPARVNYTVANIGGTEAKIVREYGFIGYADVPRFSGYPQKATRMTPPSHTQAFDRSGAIPLKAGEDRRLSIDLTHEMFDKVTQIQMNTYQGQRSGIFSICAEIQYADGVGILRKTGVRRTLDLDTWRFIADQDSEDEYAD